MTSFLMSLVARTVAVSGLAEDCEIDSRGATHLSRATWTHREDANADSFDAVQLRSSIRIPFDDIGHEVDVNDEIRIGGRDYRVAHCFLRGPVLDIGLTDWRRI